jgi:hypothetical protein
MTRALRLALGLVLGAVPVTAQSRFLLDVSGGSARHQFTQGATTLSLAPRFLWRTPALRIDAGLTYTRGASFRWNAEGGLDGAVAKRLGGGLSGELAGSGWWTVHPAGEGTGEFSFSPALRFSDRTMDLAVEGGAGHASTINGGRWFSSMGARAHRILGPLDLSGQIHRTQFGERTLRWHSAFEPSPHGRPDTLAPDTLNAIRNYSDLGVAVGWMLAGTRLVVGLEQRIGLREFRATAWHFEATRAVTADIALFGSAGRTLSALTAGLPARRYAALGLRWASGNRRRELRPAVPPDGRSIRTVREAGAEAAGVELKAPGAASVEVIGDFSNWEPMTLSDAGSGWWTLPVRLVPGLYRFNVRYDGGRWEAPAGLPSEADEFNGRVGVLLIVP